MIYRFTEVLNDLVNYFLLGDILLLEDWKQANHLSDDLAMEFTRWSLPQTKAATGYLPKEL